MTYTEFTNARFEVLSAALLKIQVFRVVQLCRWVNSSRRFEGPEFFLLRGQAVQEFCLPTTQCDILEDLNLLS